MKENLGAIAFWRLVISSLAPDFKEQEAVIFDCAGVVQTFTCIPHNEDLA